MNLHASNLPSPSRDAVREQLDRMLSSESFRGSERSTRLLRYVVEQTLNGRSERLKEYSIGTEALGRSESFDPRMDPIVRSEISRLRARLDKYYATDGRADLLNIALPKGQYVPRFQYRPLAPEAAEASAAPTAVLARAAESAAKPLWRRSIVRPAMAVLVCVLLVAVAVSSYREFASRPAVFVDPAASTPQASAISIAVLPFANMSGDAGQDFFSDGLTEEITAALARIPDLRVVARGSAFQYRGPETDVRAVGRVLGATHLLEGSVRQEGDRVRITTQLIQADSGVAVWAENYDRQLTGVIAIQEDIATAVAAALRVPLGLRPGQKLVSSRDIDPQMYQQYLRGKALVRSRGARNALADGAALLEQVVAHDPGYAPAWAELAYDYELTPAYHATWVNAFTDELRRVVNATLPGAETAARRAMQLDPYLPDAYISLGFAEQTRGHFLQADELFSKALALDPTNPDGLHSFSLLLAQVGRVNEALAMRRQLQLLDPFVPAFKGNTALVQWIAGDADAAIAVLNDLPRGDAFRGFYLPRMYAAEARYAESSAALREAPFAYAPGMRESAISLLGTAPKSVVSPQTLPRLGNMEFVYLHIGATNRVLDFYEDILSAGYPLNVATSFLWHASYAPVRKTERFKQYVRKLGLVDYWSAKGWPEFCHPTEAGDFLCS